MKEYKFTLDKVTKPLAQAAAAVKRIKEAGLKKVLPDVYLKMKAVDKATSELEKADPIVDDATFDRKAKAIQDLIVACSEALAEVDKIRSHPLHVPATVKKSGDSIEVTVLPKGVNRPTVDNLPGAGPMLRELSEKLTATKRQAQTDLKAFTGWFRKLDKDAGVEVDVPAGLTDMIESIDKNAAITMPRDQRFEATIRYEGLTQLQEDKMPQLPKQVVTEATRALSPLKELTKRNFEGWNREFARYKLDHEVDAAKSLFKKINEYFDRQLPGLIEKELTAAGEKALKSLLPSGMVAKDVQIKVTAKYDGFAEFVVNTPDFQDDDKSGDLAESLEDVLTDLDDVGEDYQGAVKKIRAQLNKASDSDVKKLAKDAAGELKTLMTDLGTANKALVKMVREVRSSTDGPVDKHQLQGLQGAINPVLRFLKDTASKKLDNLEETGKAQDLKDEELYDKKLFDELATTVKGLLKKLPTR
jgi:hypothetical protein